MTVFAHDSRHLAETYDRVSDFQFEAGKHLVERLGLEDGARVLDVWRCRGTAAPCATSSSAQA